LVLADTERLQEFFNKHQYVYNTDTGAYWRLGHVC
jgi:hypothetical protein